MESIGGSTAKEGTKEVPETQTEKCPMHDDPRHEDKNKQQGGHKQDRKDHEKPTR
jgi:hypothetical protein